MLGRFMDWLDELTGYDRQSLRAILFCLLFVPALIFGEWAVDATYDWLFIPDCDAACHQWAEDRIDEITLTPFDPKEGLDEIFDKPR